MIQLKTKMILVAILGVFLASDLVAQPYSIGTKTVTFVDSSRANRQIETEIFYPADVAGNSVPVALPVEKKFPVIVFGHGYLIGWNNYQYIWDFMVPKGFIVALPKTEDGIIPNHTDFAKDMAFIVSEFARMRGDATSMFYKKYNGKSCVMGHSMGGGCATLAVQYNPDITTLVTMAAAETNPSAITAASSITIPAVVFAGGQDCIAPMAANQTPMFDNLASDCKAFINLQDATHCHFAQNNGLCTLAELFCSGFPTNYAPTVVHTRYLFVSWLRYYLKYNAPALAKFEWKLQHKANISYIYTCASNAPRFAGDDEDVTDEVSTISFKNMYPNPVAGGSNLNLTIPSDEESDATVMITNTIGQSVYMSKVLLEEDNNEISIPVQNIKPGYYIVTVTNGEEKVSKPLIIQ